MKKRFLMLSIIVFITGHLFAQTSVKGVIKNEAGESIPGVTIMIKSSKTGTVTDIDGKYSIKVSPSDVLVISGVGLKKQEIAVGDKAQIDITMAEDAHTLDEAVVVGYGTVKRAHLTGSVATVNVKEIEDLPVSNLGASLSGRVAGVSINGGTSRPGTAASITIHNPKNFSKDGGTTSPLYIIDDIIRTEDDFNTLDASEVESMSFLKDGSAAVFGARAQQGVVLIKTKRGKEGKTVINYNGSVGISDATYMPKMMNAYQFGVYENTINTTNGKLSTDPLIYTPDELENYKTNSYNWLDMAWKTAATVRHAINLSGGNNKTTYYAGASYYYQNGNFDKINYNKWTFRASVDTKLTDALKVSLSVAGDNQSNYKYFSKINSSDDADWASLVQTPQNIPPYVNGLPVQITNTGNDRYHFFEILKSGNYKQDKITGLDVNAKLEYQVPFIKGLTAKLQYSKMYNNKFHKEFGTNIKLYTFSMLGTHKHIYGGTPSSPITVDNGDRVYYNPDYTNNYQLNAQLSYNQKFGKHEISATGVFEQAESYWEEVRVQKSGLVNNASDQFMYALSNDGSNNSTSAKETANLSYVGRANYSYADKYLAEFAFRVDASSNFAPKNYWGFFPSVSLGWVASEESFFKNNINFIDYLKLRGTIGWTGSDATRPYAWRQRYTIQNQAAVFGGDNVRNYGIKMENLPNPDVQWDHTTKYSLGLDSKFLNQRLNATIDGFFDHGYDLLATKSSTTPLTVGGAMPSENYCERNAFGYDISIEWRDKIGKDVNYYINGRLSWSDDKVIVSDQVSGNVGTWLDQNNHSSDQGVQGMHYLGMFRTQADVDNFLAKNPGYTIYGATPQPGMLYYKDIRGPKDASGQYTGPDGIIDDNDKDWISKKSSNHYGLGFTIGVGWKGLKFETVISGGFGGQDVLSSGRSQAKLSQSRPAYWADHWRPDNTNAKYPNPTYSTDYDINSEFWFVNSFRCSVKSVNLSYTMPLKINKAIGINSCKIYINGTNPLNLYNPYNFRDATSDYLSYPNLRTFSLGVNLSL